MKLVKINIRYVSTEVSIECQPSYVTDIIDKLDGLAGYETESIHILYPTEED